MAQSRMLLEYLITRANSALVKPVLALVKPDLSELESENCHFPNFLLGSFKAAILCTFTQKEALLVTVGDWAEPLGWKPREGKGSCAQVMDADFSEQATGWPL